MASRPRGRRRSRVYLEFRRGRTARHLDGNPMNIAYYLVLFLHVASCLFLIGVVLLQQGKSQDLASAFGGGGTQTAFGPRGSANVLSRATTILAGLLLVTRPAPSMLRA